MPRKWLILITILFSFSFLLALDVQQAEEHLILKEYPELLNLAKEDFYVSPNSLTYYYLGEAYAGLERDKLAAVAFNKSLDGGLLDNRYIYRIAEYYENKGKIDQAIILYEDIQSKDLSNRELKASYKLGELYFKRKEYSKVIDVFSKLIEADEKKANPLAYFVGLSYYILEDDSNAERYFELAYTQNYRDPDLFFRLAEIKNAKEQYREAIALTKEGIDLSKEEPGAETYNNLGVAYSNLNEFGLAAENFKKALSKGKKDIELYINYVQVLSRLKRYRENISFLNSLGEKTENNADLLFYLAEANDKEGNKAKALEQYEKVLSQGTLKEREVRRALERLRSAR